MKKKFQVLLTFLMIVLLVASVAACTDYQKDEEEKKETTTVSYEQLITNGTFYNSSSTSSDKYILDTVSGWTQSNGSLVTSAKGDASTGVLVSALSLADEKTFKSVTDSWQITLAKETGNDGETLSLDTPIALAYPGIDKNTPLTDKLDENGKVVKENGKAVRVQQDTNALLIASTITEGSLKVTGGSYTLAAGSVYKLQFSVCSLIDAEDGDNTKGAWFIIRGDIDYEYQCINTKNEWQTYEFYIETNKSNAMSVSLELWLGYGFSEATSDTYTKYNAEKYATRGYALFDNIICTKLVEEPENEKEAEFSSVYTGYNAEDDLHENFVNYAADVLSTKSDKDNALNPMVNALSCYYLIDADMTTSSHDTTFRSDSYRKYFNTFRGYYTTSNLKNWTKTSDTTATAYYYGVVDVSKLYNEGNESDLYNQYASDFIAMGYDNWANQVMTRDGLADGETKMLMLYNKTLAAGGFTHDDTIVIEKNTYYAISVWTYVWAKQYTDSTSYNNSDSYFAPYKATSEPEKPTDPLSKKTSDVVAYKLYVLANAEEPESYAFPKEYFQSLTTDEKAQADAYAQDLTTFATAIGVQQENLLANVKTWLFTDVGLTADEVDNDVAEDFVYTYLYFCLQENTDIVPTPAYTKDTMEGWHVTDDIMAGYHKERRDNISYVSTMKTSVETYNSKKASYDTSLAEYNIAKKAYDAACANWEQNNEYDAPYATIRLTGSGDGIEETTKGVLNSWQKVTVYVQGNQLSTRELSLNLLFGEGTDTTKHMIGGVLFDNVEIVELQKSDIPATATVHTLSEIKTEGEISFGELSVKDIESKTQADNWVAEKNKNTATTDSSLIKVNVAVEPDIQQIIVADSTYNLYALEYKHDEATASTLVYKGDESILTIAPNKCYRFAFLVKTIDIESGKGVDITLLKGEKPEDISTSFNTGVSDYNTDGKWTEIAYYIRGDLKKTWYLTMKVALGEGDRFDSDNYIKGSVKMAAFNCMEITYDEFTDAATGDKVVSGLSLYSISQDIDSNDISITNATYSTIDYSKTDKEEFDEDGTLSGIAVPSSWTIGTPIANNFTETVSNVSITEKGLMTWSAVTYNTSDSTDKLKTDVKPVLYEIWVRYTEDGQTVEKLYDTVDGTETEYTIDASFATSRECKFAVKAIGSDGVSSVSTYTSGSLTFGGNDIPAIPAETAKKKAQRATAGTILVQEGLYEEGSYADAYKSPYATALRITSDYNTALAVSTASSNTIDLDAEGTYKISVWAKTEVGTKASIVLTSSNGSLYAEVADNIIGYKQIDTNGRWQEYCFYVKTKNFDVSLTVNLCLGNPFASKKSEKKDSDEIEFYALSDLSKGNVWFDAVRIEKIEEEDFKIAKDYNEVKTEEYAMLQPSDKDIYQNIPSYIYMLEYTIDSFDASDEGDEGFGNEPNNYTHGKGSDFESADETIANEGYGVYDRMSSSVDMQNALKYLYTSQDSAKEDVLAFNNFFNEAVCSDTMLDLADGKSWTADDWSAFLNNFLKVNRTDESGAVVEDGGRNVLAMSNKLATGFAQKYSLNSGYTYKMAAGKYYKFTFSASTLLAALTWTDATTEAKATYNDGNGTWASDYVNYYVADGESYKQATSTFSASTTYYTVSYNMENAYGELRFDSGEADKDDLSVYISSYNKDAKYDSNTNLSKTYSIYIYNPEDGTDTSASWTFYLGDDPDKDDTTGLARYLVGMMAIDLVSVEEIEKDIYDAAKTAAQDADGKIDAKSANLFYEYESEEEVKDDDGDKDDDEEPTEEQNFWEKLVASDYFWLYISSFVLAVIIIVVIIVFVIRRIKKKHPKKKKIQNMVNTEKDIQVVEAAPQEKEEALESDEYVDTPKPLYVQRTTSKKKKKK